MYSDVVFASHWFMLSVAHHLALILPVSKCIQRGPNLTERLGVRFSVDDGLFYGWL